MHPRPARTKTGWVTPIQGPGSKGFPDVVAVHLQYGVIFAELKSETGILDPDQIAWRDVLLAAGQRWRLWRPSDVDLIEQVLKGDR